jgi:hypothetical protein
MPLEQSFSFIPTTKYSHGSAKEHALFLIPSQVNKNTGACCICIKQCPTITPALDSVANQVDSKSATRKDALQNDRNE